MEKEKYEPSQEEIEKAEEMAVDGEMTPEQEKMSEVRADDFEAGQHKTMEMTIDNFISEKDKMEQDKLFYEIGLSDEAKLFAKRGAYNPKTGYLSLMIRPREGDNWDYLKRNMLEIIEKAPVIKKYHHCPPVGDGYMYMDDPHSNMREIKKALLIRFPNVSEGCF